MSEGAFIKEKRRGLCVLVLVLSCLCSTEASADLNDEIRREFMQMHSVTVPDRQYETTSTKECKNVDLPCKL